MTNHEVLLGLAQAWWADCSERERKALEQRADLHSSLVAIVSDPDVTLAQAEAVLTSWQRKQPEFREIDAAFHAEGFRIGIVFAGAWAAYLGHALAKLRGSERSSMHA